MMKRIRPVHLTMAMLMATASLAPLHSLFAYSLYLQNKVEVPAGAVRLGAIARVSGADSDVVARKLLFRDLQAPRYIRASDLRRSLGAKTASDQSGIQNARKTAAAPGQLERVYGPGTWVIPLGRTLDATALNQLLASRLAELNGGADFLRGSVVRISPNTKLRVPAQGVETIFRLPARAASLRPGKRMIPLDVLSASDGKTILARHQIQLEILAKRRIAVAARDLPVGHRLSAGDFRYEERELSQNDLETRYLNEDPANRRVMANIQSGDAFTTSNVQSMPAVRRGQSLSLVYQRPGLVFRLRSVALRNGEIGETIPVRVLFPAGGNSAARSRSLNVRIVSETTVVFEKEAAGNFKNSAAEIGPGQPVKVSKPGAGEPAHATLR